jgi:hypothetical protein
MSDIVERLRRFNLSLTDDAADEIERLREVNALNVANWQLLCDDQQAEIERLHNSQNEMLAVQSNQAFYLREKNAEIERLHKDAARYRFIRQDLGGLGVYIVNGNLEVLSLDEADKAIDASMEALGDS